MTSHTLKCRSFQALHAGPRGFVMPNAWDAGSAAILAEAGFAALATTSAGIAFSLGRPDFDVRDPARAVGRDAMFERIRQIVDAVDLPVNGDLEDGWGAAPEAVAETIRIASAAGLAGGNIEDHDPRAGALYDEELAAERIRAAREAIESAGSGFVLTARCDARPTADGAGLAACLRRFARYREAGADVLYAPRFDDPQAIAVLVRDGGGPVNVVIGLGSTALTVPALLDAGVTRVSLGGSIARAALGFLRRAAAELAEQGSIGFADGQIRQRELNALFARARG